MRDEVEVISLQELQKAEHAVAVLEAARKQILAAWDAVEKLYPTRINENMPHAGAARDVQLYLEQAESALVEWLNEESREVRRMSNP